jgi:predicted nucleic acid-binding protein
MTRSSGNEINAVARIMVDANVLLYSHDHAEPAKQVAAAVLIDRLTREGQIILSAQALNEFFWNATRTQKRKRKGLALMGEEDAARIVQRWCNLIPIVPVTRDVTLRAIRSFPRHSLSFWDALIWAAAKENGVGLI